MAAASARRASSCRSAAKGSAEVSTRSKLARSYPAVSCDGSASPAKRSSGASRAIATARSANCARVRPDTSDADTQACRLPTNTRNPISIVSDRSACSNVPARVEMDKDRPASAIASALSAPALRASSRRDRVRSESERVMQCPVPGSMPDMALDAAACKSRPPKVAPGRPKICPQQGPIAGAGRWRKNPCP